MSRSIVSLSLISCFALGIEAVPGRGLRIVWRPLRSLIILSICSSSMSVWPRIISWLCIMMPLLPGLLADRSQFRTPIILTYRHTWVSSRPLEGKRFKQPTIRSLFSKMSLTNLPKNPWISNSKRLLMKRSESTLVLWKSLVDNISRSGVWQVVKTSSFDNLLQMW